MVQVLRARDQRAKEGMNMKRFLIVGTLLMLSTTAQAEFARGSRCDPDRIAADLRAGHPFDAWLNDTFQTGALSAAVFRKQVLLGCRPAPAVVQAPVRVYAPADSGPVFGPMTVPTITPLQPLPPPVPVLPSRGPTMCSTSGSVIGNSYSGTTNCY